MRLLNDCASWLRTKTGLVIVVGLMIGIIALERSVGALLAGAAPLLMLLACLLPCAIPLLLLRRDRPAVMPSTSEAACGCGDPACAAPTSRPD